MAPNKVYDTPSGMGGTFTVSIIGEQPHIGPDHVLVRVHSPRTEWDDYKFTTTRAALTKERTPEPVAGPQDPEQAGRSCVRLAIGSLESTSEADLLAYGVRLHRSIGAIYNQVERRVYEIGVLLEVRDRRGTPHEDFAVRFALGIILGDASPAAHEILELHEIMDDNEIMNTANVRR